MADNNEEKNVSSADSTPSKSSQNNEPIKENHTELDNLQELAENSLDSLQDSVSKDSSSHSKEKYIPGPFPKHGKPLADIKQNLLSLISQCEAEEEDLISYVRWGIDVLGRTPQRLKRGSAPLARPRKWMDSEVQKAALLSHTMAAYISTLDKNLVHRITMQLTSDTSLWLSKIFRFFDSLAYFSNDSKEGLIRVIRMVLLSKYPKYSNAGFEVLFTRPPVLYYCDPRKLGIGEHLSYLCSQLGLPLSCLTPIPCISSSVEGQFKMDPVALEKYIKDDLSTTKTPLVVLANAGLSLLGHIDNLQKIHEICIAHNVWLHVQGYSLAALSLLPLPKVPSSIGDSLSLSLGNWIGLPSLPHVTLYRPKDISHLDDAGLVQALLGQMDFLPVWIALQTMGHENFIQRIRLCFDLSDKLLEYVEQFAELRIISKRKTISKDTQIPESPTSVMAMLEALTPVIVFQYTTKEARENDTIEKNPPYYDNLNSWLVQLLCRQVQNIGTEIGELEGYGVCIRLCPLEWAHFLGTSLDDVEQYYQCLKQQITILNATVLQREKLYRDHKDHRKLQLVEIANWAGMGGVRFIPEFWADRLNELTDTGKADINQLNSELVAKLRAADSAFSLGEADDGMLCVRFGMVDDNLDMEELITLVTTAGQELEESSKFLETMSEMIKHGIEEANKELIQENQEKLMQEGILRQVPVLGSLVSWWYPAPSETGIKGRSFNLSSGTIESTENIYKYHMQIKEGSKSPPTIAKVAVPSSSSQATVPAEQNSNIPGSR